jgi:hypothetical protein
VYFVENDEFWVVDKRLLFRFRVDIEKPVVYSVRVRQDNVRPVLTQFRTSELNEIKGNMVRLIGLTLGLVRTETEPISSPFNEYSLSTGLALA